MAFLKAVIVFIVFNVASNVEYVQAADKGVKVRFDPHTYEVSESIGQFFTSIVLEGTHKGDIEVTYKTVDGEAKENTDYKPATGTVVFTPKQHRKYIAIDIIDDTVTEAKETFKVQITDVKAKDSNDVVTIGVPKEAVVTILDDDKKVE